MRYFYLWCETCPTQVIVETDVPVDAPGAYYASGDGPHQCPACHDTLHDWDDIAGHFPEAMNNNTPEVRRRWREWLRTLRDSNPRPA